MEPIYKIKMILDDETIIERTTSSPDIKIAFLDFYDEWVRLKDRVIEIHIYEETEY